jgi:hypothetical protein
MTRTIAVARRGQQRCLTGILQVLLSCLEPRLIDHSHHNGQDRLQDQIEKGSTSGASLRWGCFLYPDGETDCAKQN